MTIREVAICSVAAFTSLQNKNYIIFSVSLWPVKELKNQSSGISVITSFPSDKAENWSKHVNIPNGYLISYAK